jgi:LPXTG-site transpeptidase (sortase) family protein
MNRLRKVVCHSTEVRQRCRPMNWSYVLVAVSLVLAFPHRALAKEQLVTDGADPIEVAQVFIPRLSAKVWGFPVFSGVSADILDLGIGWFPESARPGERGNFSVIGHRTVSRAPFYFFENLAVGDEIVVRTWKSWFVYKLSRQQVVTPASTWVLDPIPKPFSVEQNTDRLSLITLMTCTPRATSRMRWIWWGTLTSVHPPEDPPQSLVNVSRHRTNLERDKRLLQFCYSTRSCMKF